jgi:hypothetical protein
MVVAGIIWVCTLITAPEWRHYSGLLNSIIAAICFSDSHNITVDEKLGIAITSRIHLKRAIYKFTSAETGLRSKKNMNATLLDAMMQYSQKPEPNITFQDWVQLLHGDDTFRVIAIITGLLDRSQDSGFLADFRFSKSDQTF